MQQLYKHYTDYKDPWPWVNFTPHEVSCKHCGELYLDIPSMDALQHLREWWNKPIVINSGHRCISHNKNVGGVDDSQHLALAFDCRCAREDQIAFTELAKKCGFNGIGLYPNRGFVHIDIREKPATW